MKKVLVILLSFIMSHNLYASEVVVEENYDETQEFISNIVYSDELDFIDKLRDFYNTSNYYSAGNTHSLKNAGATYEFEGGSGPNISIEKFGTHAFTNLVNGELYVKLKAGQGDGVFRIYKKSTKNLIHEENIADGDDFSANLLDFGYSSIYFVSIEGGYVEQGYIRNK